MKIVTTVTTDKDDIMLRQCNPSKYLELIACGFYDLRNTPYTFKCIRKTGECKNYMLQILLSGQGFHTIDGVTHTLHAGQCILYEPNAPQHIIHYGADDPVMAWLHFYGHGATELVEDLKLQGIHMLHTTSGVKKQVLTLARESRSLLPDSPHLCQSYLIQFLVTLSRSFKDNSLYNYDSDKIAPAINHILTEYAAHSLSNKEYAQMCYLSESRFSHIFKEVTGTTPKKLIEQKRIEAAKEIFTSSSTRPRIFEVARAVGYEDPYYFSRIFKKNTGVSPEVFLKQCDK